MAVYSKNRNLAMIAIILLTAWTGEVVAVSQFLNDASFSIVDTDLSTASSTSPNTSTSTQSDILQNLKPLSGFNRPVLLRGDDSLDTTTGVFHINADGCYVFVIHRLGVALGNPNMTLSLIPSSNTTKDKTLAVLKDTADGDIITTHVVVELRRGDRVLIANPLYADVIGTEDNPFIYNAFLLYHTPISSTPKVRQSAFSVTVTGNTSIEGEAFRNYDSPAVHINGDFDTESGTFSTSVKGLYVFHLSATFTSLTILGGRPAVAITVNDSERARVQARVGMTQLVENAGVTITLPMVKGDTVQLRNVFENPDVDCFATFAGYLLA